VDLKKELKADMESELFNDILPFWIKNTLDLENGGFYGEISNDLVIDNEAPKGAILNSRILWTFSSAYRMTNNDEYLKIAKRAYEYIINKFWDNEFSGVYWAVDYKGNPLDTKKQVYAEAFVIYGLSEYYRATKEEESLLKAIELFDALEKHSYDKEYNGYFEGYTREWVIQNDLRLSAKDMNEKKSMNTHLHVMEAYTNLLRVKRDQRIEDSVRNLINITIDHIIDSKTKHFKLFFDEQWNSKADIISYGHDIEGSWLLYEAAEVLGDAQLLEKVKQIAIHMAQATFDEGIDKNGSIFNESEDGVFDAIKDWWPQAEAVVGFLNAYQLTEKEHFLNAAYNSWQFIDKNVIDKVNGEWFWGVTKEGKSESNQPKVGFWKCPYHNSRACMEIMSRIK
jgi:mannobiose 2-epimerase